MMFPVSTTTNHLEKSAKGKTRIIPPTPWYSRKDGSPFLNADLVSLLNPVVILDTSYNNRIQPSKMESSSPEPRLDMTSPHLT